MGSNSLLLLIIVAIGIFLDGIGRSDSASSPPLLVDKNGKFNVSQITASGITDKKDLERLQYNCCKTDSETKKRRRPLSAASAVMLEMRHLCEGDQINYTDDEGATKVGVCKTVDRFKRKITLEDGREIRAETLVVVTEETGTASGLCLSPTGKPTIKIEFEYPTQVHQLVIQPPKDYTVGYIKTFKITYNKKKGDTNAIDIPEPNYTWTVFSNGPANSISGEESLPLRGNPNPILAETLIVQIESFESQPCLRMEVLGCPDKECPLMWDTPTVDAVDTGNGDNTVKFQCSVNASDLRTGVLHKATWVHDGTNLANIATNDATDQDIVVSTLHQNDLYEYLPDSTNTPQAYIGGLKCEVAACNASGCAAYMSPKKVSNELLPTAEYDLGAGKTNVTIQEGKGGVDISLKLNGPPVLFLKKDIIAIATGTNVVVEARFIIRTASPCASATTSREEVVIEETCGRNIHSRNWKQSHKLTLMAVTDGLYSDEVVNRKCNIILKHLDTTGRKRAWTTLTKEVPFDVFVKVADGWEQPIKSRPGSTCHAVNDPHLKTFDQFYYDVHLVGEFILFRNKKYNYQINAIFTWCARGIACICGVAVKAGDDVVVMDKCRGTPIAKKVRTGGWWFFRRPFKIIYYMAYYFRIIVWKNGDLTPGLKVYRRGHNNYYVYLPTGTYLGVWVTPNLLQPYLSLVIEPSLADLEQTEGLCGHYDGKKTGEFTNKDGSPFPNVDFSSQSNPWINSYGEEWREGISLCKSKSIFFGVPADPNPVPVTTYCTCVLGSDSYDCGEHKDFFPCVPTRVVDDTPDGTTAKVEAKTPDLNRCNPPSSGRKKRAATYTPPVGEDDEYQSFVFETKFVPKTLSWPTTSGWTEAKAKKYCEDFLLTKDAVKNCQKFMGQTYATEINNCVFDIKATDATDFANATLENIISQCIAEAQKYPVTVTELPGGIKKTTLYNSCCLDNCNNNGVCKEALCVCNPGFYGSTCSLTKDIPPNIVYMSRNGLCNTRTRDCTTSYIFGIGHIESPDLKCRMTPYDRRNGIRDTKGQFTTTAIYHNFNMLACPHSEKNGTFLVAVSNNNGKDYSKFELLFLAYDSACHNCSSVDQDEKKANCTQEVKYGCAVGSACYLDGEVDEGSICRICDTNLNINNWSVNTAYSNCTKVPEDDNVALIAGVTTAVLVVAIIIIVVLALKFCKKNKSVHPPSAADIQEEARATGSASEQPVQTNGERKLSGISTGDIKPAWNL